MKTFKYWLPVLLWAGVIFTFSSMTVTPTSKEYLLDFLFKKTAHFVEYFVFYILVYRGIKNTSNLSTTRAGLISLAIACFYAISDEYHQSFTPGREPKVRDILIDSFAASAALIFVWKYLPKAPKRLKALAQNFHLA